MKNQNVISIEEFLIKSWGKSPPESWDRVKLGQILDEVTETVPAESVDQLTPSVVHGVVPQESLENKPQQALREGYELLRAQPDDFVVSMSSHEYGIEHCEITGGISPDYTLLRPKIEPEQISFLKYLFKSKPFIETISLLSSGIRQGKRIYWSELRNVEICLPSPEISKLITSYLRHHTQNIDGLIEGYERTLKVIDGKKKTTITKSVTNGVSSQGPMKKTNVEWADKIPEHWDSIRLKFLLNDIEQGWSPQCERKPADNDEWGVLKVGCVNNMSFKPNENKRLPEDLDPKPELEVKKGDILMSRANTRELVGSCARVKALDSKLMICDKIYRFDLDESLINPDYLVFVLNSSPSRKQIELDATGASKSMVNISQKSVKELWIPLPPLDEQKEIAEYIEQEVQNLSQIKSKTQETIDLLQEKRRTLITQVITGQISLSENTQYGEKRVSL